MAIPYIPGAWDMLKGSAVPFTNELLRTIRPEVFGAYDMNQMLKQNPMLASQLAGMESGQRDAFAQAFGLKNAGASPIANIGTTPQLRAAQTQEQLQTEALNADRPGVLTQFGARTPEQQQVDATKPMQAQLAVKGAEQGLEIGAQNLAAGAQTIELNNYKLADAKRKSQEIEAAFAAYPDLEGINIPQIAAASVQGRPVDPNLMNRIMQNEGASQLYAAYEKTIRDQMAEGFLRGRIQVSAGTKDYNMMLDAMNQGSIAADREVNRAMQQLKDFRAENKIAFIGGTDKFSAQAPTEVKAEYNRLKQAVGIATDNVASYNEARAKLLKIPYNETSSGTEQQIQQDPETQRAMMSYQSAKTDAARQRIRDTYRQRTGKELPL